MLVYNNSSSTFFELDVGETSEGRLGLQVNGRRCLNEDCNRAWVSVNLYEGAYVGGNFRGKAILDRWQLRPDSLAKPQPTAVPAPLASDYYEACKIRDLSPKASATLSRRCLQGMIRDFCGIKARTLHLEIEALKEVVNEGKSPPGVTIETMDAIDAVRSIGNIGAHMEADINVIVDVDPGEAQDLIELIELLFEEWYVARETRKKRLARVTQIADAKKALKAVPTKSEADAVGIPDAEFGEQRQLPKVE
jgi:hypothetical protein